MLFNNLILLNLFLAFSFNKFAKFFPTFESFLKVMNFLVGKNDFSISFLALHHKPNFSS